MEYFVAKTLESALLSHLYPRTQIQVILQELQRDGPLLAPAINAGIAAMLESGLSMAGLLAAVCVAVDSQGQELLLDPNAVQAQQSSCCLTLVFSRQSNKVKLVSIHHEQKFSIFLMNKIVRLARAAAEQVFDFYQDSIRKRFMGTTGTNESPMVEEWKKLTDYHVELFFFITMRVQRIKMVFKSCFSRCKNEFFLYKINE